MQVRIIALLYLRSTVKLVTTSGICIYIYFHSINFSVIDFPSLRMYFPFCFLPGLHLGCAPHDVPLSTIRAIYSTVQYRKDQQEPLGEEQEMQDSLANMVNDLDV